MQYYLLKIVRTAERRWKVEKMSDYIDRQAAIDRINIQRAHLKPEKDFRDALGDAAYRVCIEMIERLPSAEEGVTEARWLWGADVRCSGCGYKLQTTGLPQYCPNCGAKMCR